MRRFACWVLYLGPLKPWAVRIAVFVAHGVWPRIYGARHIPRRGPLVLAAAASYRLRTRAQRRNPDTAGRHPT